VSSCQNPDMNDLKAFIAGMPKAELHMHVEGALEPSLLRIIAERNELPVPPFTQDQNSS
jgi:adenine deaminase